MYTPFEDQDLYTLKKKYICIGMICGAILGSVITQIINCGMEGGGK